ASLGWQAGRIDHRPQFRHAGAIIYPIDGWRGARASRGRFCQDVQAMNISDLTSLRPATDAASPEKTLRRLFLTLFLRGRSSRGLRKESAPKSVGSKLALALVFYALFGMFALVFQEQPVFALSVCLHAMTL